ncbi:hypothetical protein M595_0446 [Lyngbya aestuarii BL J]|uniref:Uncharacterized protein n=1 Tax=Lyngbya aestuarii BL J TaxID=1348334 RepID=U7QQL3_9CYAN|nr:hypothetical protein M595_0446 [Lyngbya aestuarii BL J]
MHPEAAVTVGQFIAIYRNFSQIKSPRGGSGVSDWRDAHNSIGLIGNGIRLA